MRISMIAALADNRVIGRDGDMPWHLSEDMRYFKAKTLGKPVIMGRQTFESMGRPLPRRPNIVVTRNRDFAAADVAVAHDIEAALTLAKGQLGDGDEVMIIGGGQIYEQALRFADRLYLTEIHAKPDGDTFFPEFDRAEWREVRREAQATPDSLDYDFVILERIVDGDGAG